MKTYNRALDYTVLALDELRKGKPVLAARLLATAVQQPDLEQAIATLEASNSYAFKLNASKSRLRAGADEEFPFKVESENDEEEFEHEPEMEVAEFEGDPLDEVGEEDEETAPAQAMAKVLSSMVAKRR